MEASQTKASNSSESAKSVTKGKIGDSKADATSQNNGETGNSTFPENSSIDSETDEVKTSLPEHGKIDSEKKRPENNCGDKEGTEKSRLMTSDLSQPVTKESEGSDEMEPPRADDMSKPPVNGEVRDGAGKYENKIEGKGASKRTSAIDVEKAGEKMKPSIE